MARLNINPTRMELQNLRQRLNTATKGHRLLKNKSDEMIRQFIKLSQQNKALRTEVEEALQTALKAFVLARNKESSQTIKEALCMTEVNHSFLFGLTNIMGLNVPNIEITTKNQEKTLPYSLLTGNSKLDQSILQIDKLFVKIIQLAQVEKTCNMLTTEIVKTRRRVNALEFVLIPQIEETIKYIVMKLEENERNSIIRLMKVKDEKLIEYEA